MAKKPRLVLGQTYYVEVRYPAWRGISPAITFRRQMKLIDLRDGNTAIMEQTTHVPTNVKPDDRSYSHMLVNGMIIWGTGTKLVKVKKSWIKNAVGAPPPAKTESMV